MSAAKYRGFKTKGKGVKLSELPENERKQAAAEDDWEDVYHVESNVDELIGIHEPLQKFRSSSRIVEKIPHPKFSHVKILNVQTIRTQYFQTFGGGPEGGYFVRRITSSLPDVEDIEEVYKVKRGWGEPFTALTRYANCRLLCRNNADGQAQVKLIITDE